MLRRVLISTFVLVSALKAQQQTPSPPAASPDSSVLATFAKGSSTSFPVEVREIGIRFRVRINDSPRDLFFTLDSGSSSTHLDAQTAKDMGLTPFGGDTVQGAGSGRVAVQHLENVRFELPGLVTVLPQINTLDFAGVSPSWGGLDGLLGYDFFLKFVVAIDYDAGRVTLADPANFVYEGSGEILPITFKGRQPWIHAVIKVPGSPAHESPFLVDSGSGDGANHWLITKSTGSVRRTQVGVGFGEPGSGALGTIQFLRLGRFIIRGAPSVCCSAHVNEKDDTGQIGNAVWEKFKVIFDYSRNRMILEPGKRYR